MANRFPLIVDVEDGNKLKEIPEGDSLNFSSVGIANLTSLSVTGALSGSSLSSSGTLSVTGYSIIGGTLAVGSTLSATGAITGASLDVTGTVDANNFTVNGAALSTIQVQSDWIVGDVNSPAFIKNKPNITVIAELNDIGDVFVSDAVLGDVLTWDGASWQATPAAGGTQLTDFSVVNNPASGTGSLGYNEGSGVFTYTPPVVFTAVSQLTNDSGFTTLAAVDSQGYLQTSDVLSTGRITTSIATGQVTIGFSDTGLLTTITVSGNLSGDGTGASPIVLNDNISLGIVNATSAVTPSTFKDVGLDNLTVGLTIASTNGNFTTTNGNIVATNGNVTAGATVQGADVTGTVSVNTPALKNTAGNLSLESASSPSAVVLTNGVLRFSGIVPGSPAVGDLWGTGFGIYFRAGDDGSAGELAAGPDTTFIVGGPGSGIPGQPGMIVPWFETADRPASPAAGEMYFDFTDSITKIWNGSAWRNLHT